jgi:hypothetical protein
MANTYTQLYIQFVFTVKGRGSFIKESFRDEFLLLLEKFNADYNSKYLFEWYD